MYLGAMVRLRACAYACIVSLTSMERAMAIPAMNLQPSARLSFDRFELDELDARLTCDGQPVALPPRPFAVLCELARKPGHLVTKGELLDAVWGHRFVTESVLKSAISDLRAALHDDPKQPRYIETVSRRGYRFIVAPVDAPARCALIAEPRPVDRCLLVHGSAPSSAIERDDAGGPGYPALAALTALCRGDAALADLIRTVAATLERERLASNTDRMATVG